MTTTTRSSDHAIMLNSPTYAALYARHGRTMSGAAAAKFAARHGVTVADYADDGLNVHPSGRVSTLELVMVAGY